ncbi:O-antigen polymerase [Helicobacter bizzozeronii]|nr:O-antigen polymerase [Helicobacter bizzozeronii]
MQPRTLSQCATLFFALFFLTSFKKPLPQILLVVLAVGALGYYWKYKPPLRLDHPTKWLVGAFLLMAVAVLPNLFVESDLKSWHENLRLLNMPLVYVLGVVSLVFLSSVRVCLNQRYLFYSMGVACTLNGVIALVQRIGFDVARVVGFSTIVGFVTLTSAALFGCYIYALHSKQPSEKILLGIAMLLGLVVVLLSGTRSASIAFVATFVILSLFILYRQKSWRSLPYILIISALFVGMFVSVHILENQKILHGPRNAQEGFSHDLKLYADKNPDSSIGSRLARWQEALVIVRLSPFFGMSISTKCKHIAEIVTRAQSYRDPKSIDCKERYDNEIFNALAHRGLLGLFALLLLWVVVWRAFARTLDQDPLVSLFLLSLLCFYIVLGIGFDPFDFFIEGSFFVALVVMGVLQTRPNPSPPPLAR